MAGGLFGRVRWDRDSTSRPPTPQRLLLRRPERGMAALLDHRAITGFTMGIVWLLWAHKVQQSRMP